MKYFNTAGPVRCEKHYCLPPLERFDLGEILELIDAEKYFVLHAPRQTGKTSCLLALQEYLNKEGKYKALYVNVEVGQGAREDVYGAIRAIMYEVSYQWRRVFKDENLLENYKDILESTGEYSAFKALLSFLSEHSDRPVPAAGLKENTALAEKEQIF